MTAWQPRSASAILDVADRGPELSAGALRMRVTNAGILGNAFYDKGLSFDASLEFPRGSGHEALGHAEVWVGAELPDGSRRVSGGPMLEWRPTEASHDRVRMVRAGQLGSLWRVDDDQDGRSDEDPPNGRDDDGDGRIDEDCGAVADEWATSEYTDDGTASIQYVYPTGESHVPLHLKVHQDAFAWSIPGYDRVAGYEFTVTNTGSQILRQLRLGVFADLDSRDRNSASGHLDDRLDFVDYAEAIPEGVSSLGPAPYEWKKTCVTQLSGRVPVVSDAKTGSLPSVSIVGLSHTTDPLGFLTNFTFPGAREAAAAARAPRRDTTFRYSLFAQDLPPGQGGPPRLDADRFRALEGTYPQAPAGTRDWTVLISCGPFAQLDPGQSLRFAVAFVVAARNDSIPPAAVAARMLRRGTRYNLQPDGAQHAYDVGVSGLNGHEICYEPPPGVAFDYDPHCPPKFYEDPAYKPYPDGLFWIRTSQVSYRLGQCVWSDFDCDACTGFDGKETAVPWQIGGLLPPRPELAVVAADTSATLAWDNLPEIMLRQNVGWAPGYQFAGYRIYRLDDWRRRSLLPGPERWQRIRSMLIDGIPLSGSPLAECIDSSVAPDSVIFGDSHFPVGRYRYVDQGLLDGFDYLYVVTTLYVRISYIGGSPVISELESALTARFEDRIVPRTEARTVNGKVWVVPNPYRGGAEWERTPVPGDSFTRHLDFFGLPRARAVIRIFTVSGDLVREIVHEGGGGDGQARWDLISRNGQDAESGVYLFSVDSPLGHQVGRFVVIR